MDILHIFLKFDWNTKFLVTSKLEIKECIKM